MTDRINEFITYITFRCNYKCKMCTQEGISQMKELNAKEWDKIFKDIEKNYPDSTLIILGGEPTLHKNFVEILERATCRNINKHIVTNGYFLEKYLPDIKRNYCGVTVSIDGIGKTHDTIRNHEGAFEKAENVLMKMHEMNQHLLPEEEPIYYNINFVMLPDNIDEIYDFIDRMLKHDPREIVLNHPRYVSTEKDNEMHTIMTDLYTHSYTQRLMMRQDTGFSEEYVQKLNKTIEDIKSKYDPEIIKEFPNFTEQERLDYYNDEKAYKLRKNQRCLSPQKIPFFFPDGTVASCLYNVLGNATKQPIEKIWNNEIANKTRFYLNKNGNFPTCARCTCFYKEECEE